MKKTAFFKTYANIIVFPSALKKFWKLSEDLFGLHIVLIEHFDEIKSEFVLASQLTAQDVKSLIEKAK